MRIISTEFWEKEDTAHKKMNPLNVAYYTYYHVLQENYAEKEHVESALGRNQS